MHRVGSTHFSLTTSNPKLQTPNFTLLFRIFIPETSIMERRILLTIFFVCTIVFIHAQDLGAYGKKWYINSGDTLPYRLLLPEHLTGWVVLWQQQCPYLQMPGHRGSPGPEWYQT